MTQHVIPTEKAIEDRTEGTFRINEMFYSIQGEGRLAGMPMVFVRFSDCNLRCTVRNAGFDCDTEFVSGSEYTIDTLLSSASALNPKKGWVLFTGGEPGLQLSEELLVAFKDNGWKTAIETNGTMKLPSGLDWICVSPKTAEHTLAVTQCDEVKYVRRAGMAIPSPKVKARYYSISPAFQSDGGVCLDDLQWCIELCKQNPTWMLSFQMHKILNVR